MVTWPMTSCEFERSRSWPQYIWGYISRTVQTAAMGEIPVLQNVNILFTDSINCSHCLLLFAALFLSAPTQFPTCCGNSSDIFSSLSTKRGRFSHRRLSFCVMFIYSANTFAASAKANESFSTTGWVSKLFVTLVSKQMLLRQLCTVLTHLMWIQEVLEYGKPPQSNVSIN